MGNKIIFDNVTLTIYKKLFYSRNLDFSIQHLQSLYRSKRSFQVIFLTSPSDILTLLHRQSHFETGHHYCSLFPILKVISKQAAVIVFHSHLWLVLAPTFYLVLLSQKVQAPLLYIKFRFLNKYLTRKEMKQMFLSNFIGRLA